MVRAHSGLLTQPLEGNALVAQVADVPIYVTARGFNRGIGSFRTIGTAALAGAESSALRRFDGREERDVIALGFPRRAGGTAIDAGRRDAIEEALVGGRVPLQHRFPRNCFIHGNTLRPMSRLR